MISIGIFNTLNGNNGLLNVIKLYYLYGMILFLMIFAMFISDIWITKYI